MKKIALFLLICLISLLFGCEPTDWQYILDGPADLESVVFDYTPLDGFITVNFVIPRQPISAIRDEVSCDIYLEYSEVGSSVKDSFSDTYMLMYLPGTASSQVFNQNLPTTGIEYVFTIYVLDENGKPSQGVPSDPITW